MLLGFEIENSGCNNNYNRVTIFDIIDV